jgi:chromate reductase
MLALVQPEVMIAKAHEKFDASGNLTDEKTRGYIKRFIEALVAWTRLLEKGKT